MEEVEESYILVRYRLDEVIATCILYKLTSSEAMSAIASEVHFRDWRLIDILATMLLAFFYKKNPELEDFGIFYIK